MDYYRKAAAVFILVMTLVSPLFMEREKKVALVEVQTLVAESQKLNYIKENRTKKRAEKEIMELIRKSAAEFAQKNNYSSVITKHAIYKGGDDISSALAEKIDKEVNLIEAK